MTDASDSALEVLDVPDRRRFEARAGATSDLAGFAQYTLHEHHICFTHTEVDDTYEGQGVGSSLVREALDEVRRRGGLRVVSSCPFVSSWIGRHPDYEDLLAD